MRLHLGTIAFELLAKALLEADGQLLLPLDQRNLRDRVVDAVGYGWTHRLVTCIVLGALQMPALFPLVSLASMH